jgi:hypothetical protein
MQVMRLTDALKDKDDAIEKLHRYKSTRFTATKVLALLLQKYLLYCYKRTNTDTPAHRELDLLSFLLLNALALLVEKYKH